MNYSEKDEYRPHQMNTHRVNISYPARARVKHISRSPPPSPSCIRRVRSSPTSIEVFVVEKGVMTFTGVAETEEHYGFHALYKETNQGLTVYVTKEHPNQAAAVLWCYLK